MNIFNKILFPKISWWVWVLLPLTFFGFYPTYFSKLFTKLPSVFHVHAFFMLLWIIMVLVQPWLIFKKRTKIHKRIGRISYFLMPVVLFTAWLMIRHSYFNFMTDESAKHATAGKTIAAGELALDAAEYMRIGILYWLWLGIFYTLAIVNRKEVVSHATFMFAAILTLLGPTVDRIIIPIYVKNNWNIDFFISTFILIDVLLISLLIHQWRKQIAVKAVVLALSIYVVGQSVFYLFPRLYMWKLIIDPFG
jgi:hypothetical protein